MNLFNYSSIRGLLFGLASIGLLAHSAASEPARGRWAEFRNGGESVVAGQLPTTWSPDSIAWQFELSGYGQSTPVIYDDRVFVTSVVGPMKDECLVSCFDLKSGRQLWVARHPATEKAASNYMAARAAPTPVVDQQGLIAFFESGDCVAVDHSGKQRWHRSLTADFGKFDNNHGLGSSPTQTDELVIINIEHRGPSYLIALDKSTGSTRWKAERASSSSWSSPIVVNLDATPQLVVSSGGTVDGYSPSSGQSLWSIGGLDGNSVPSPTPAQNMLFVGARLAEFGSDGEAAKSNLCIQFSSARPTVDKPTIAWRASKAISDYASPVVCQQCVYYLNKVGVLHCLNQQTGESHYMERLGTQCWATPIVNEDRIYFFGKDGRTQIVRAGPKFDLISSNALWDSANPPKPESYVENNNREQSPAPADGSKDSTSNTARTGGGRGAGMQAALLKADADGDGQLSASEIPSEFKPMLARIDLNSDGTLDAAELKAMAESFAARRADSRDTARDPIVYGAAAVNGTIVVRTGTRLYCIHKAD